MRVIANMVTKNEADRYLDSCLTNLNQYVDDIFIYDDKSEDDTVALAEHYDAHVLVRDDRTPSFREAEGFFRYRGWMSMVEATGIRYGDWVLNIDADEFIVDNLQALLLQAEDELSTAVNFKIHEIWSLNPFLKRVDGFWDTITGVRLVRYDSNQDQHFRHTGMASGSIPQYGFARVLDAVEKRCCILHCGYADSDDKKVKYDFYSSKTENGHNNKHIQSIMFPGQLTHVGVGNVPKIWRGNRSL